MICEGGVLLQQQQQQQQRPKRFFYVLSMSYIYITRCLGFFLNKTYHCANKLEGWQASKQKKKTELAELGTKSHLSCQEEFHALEIGLSTTTSSSFSPLNRRRTAKPKEAVPKLLFLQINIRATVVVNQKLRAIEEQAMLDPPLYFQYTHVENSISWGGMMVV